ncbi:MAG: SDR family NAD(P)-dependent oxidoreductase [Herminiimonas sp.]|nr:SDR family NAD(P)-dependent oxidoreductase [Herminiimonas sp.]
MQNASLLRDHELPINALVVGATGGIGFALSAQLAANAQVARLFVVARAATKNASLADLIAQSGERVVAIDCDIRDEAALANMAAAITAAVPALHLIINTAGMLHDSSSENDVRPEKSLMQITAAGLQASFAINAFGPILLAKALLPLLRHAAPVVFASLSARVGSISDNRAGGWYSYRAAKAAQNQLLKTLAIELARLNRQSIVLALHPGTTDSSLSKPFQANVRAEKLFTPAFAAASLLQVIAARLPADSGNFYAWDGQPIGW